MSLRADLKNRIGTVLPDAQLTDTEQGFKVFTRSMGSDEFIELAKILELFRKVVYMNMYRSGTGITMVISSILE